MFFYNYCYSFSGPNVDPDANDEVDVSSKMERNFLFILGTSRTLENRTEYNLNRPIPVLGGVSDNEVAFLQSARGPLAKVSLCHIWLQEFLSREYLAKSTGPVPPPIVSRIFGEIANGLDG